MTHYLDYPGLTYYHGRLNSYIGEELATLLPKSEEGEILYVYAGQVDNYSDLPTDANPGDVYNVINADPDNNVKAGDNIAWTGTEWDDLSGYIDTSLYEKYADALADKEELLAEVSDIDTDLTDNYVTSESFESIMSEYVKTAEVEFDKLTDEEIIRAFSPWYWVKLPEDSEGNLVTDINAYYIGNDYYWHKFVYSNNGYIGVPKRLVNPNGFATDCHTMITCEALNDEEQYCPTVAAFVDGNGIYNNDPVIFGTDFDVSKTPIMIAAPSQYAGNMPDVDTSALQETVSNCGDKYGFIYDIKDYDVDTVIELTYAEEKGIDPTNGTLAISGNLDLSEDFKVNGNVTVSGNVTGTGTLSATGTITVSGSTEATVKEGASLSECDISVDDGTTTFNSDTTVADGKVSVGGTGVTNAADCVVYCDMEIESTGTGIENTKTFTVPSDVTINITNTDNGTEAYGIYNHTSANFEAYGNININNSGSGNSKYAHAIYNHDNAHFTIAGKTSLTCTGTGSNTYAHGIFNNAIFNITENATVDITNRVAAILGHGIYNFNGGAFTLAGKITIDNIGTATGSDVYLYALCNEHGGALFTITETANVEATNAGYTNNGSVHCICNYDTSELIINGTVTATNNGSGLLLVGFANISANATVNGTVYINSFGTGDIVRGLNNTNESRLVINGSIVITTDGTGVATDSTITGTGTMTVNGEPYSF